MKALFIISLALLGSGCETTKFTNDPRAFLVGPDYLDAIAQHPRDRDTQFYYPLLALPGITNSVDLRFGPTTPSLGSKVDALLIDIPEPTEEVRQITGKGWVLLEREGIPISGAMNH